MTSFTVVYNGKKYNITESDIKAIMKKVKEGKKLSMFERVVLSKLKYLTYDEKHRRGRGLWKKELKKLEKKEKKKTKKHTKTKKSKTKKSNHTKKSKHTKSNKKNTANKCVTPRSLDLYLKKK